MTNLIVTSVPADGLVFNSDRSSVDTVMIKFESHVYMEPVQVLKWNMVWPTDCRSPSSTILTLVVLDLFQGTLTYIFLIHWDGTGSLFARTTFTLTTYVVNTMADDDLTMEEARKSLAMVLTHMYWNILVSVPDVHPCSKVIRIFFGEVYQAFSFIIGLHNFNTQNFRCFLINMENFMHLWCTILPGWRFKMSKVWKTRCQDACRRGEDLEILMWHTTYVLHPIVLSATNGRNSVLLWNTYILSAYIYFSSNWLTIWTLE